MFLDVFGKRVNLKRQVATLHGVKKIETNRELGAKAPVHRVAQQLARMAEDEINRRHLNRNVAEAEQKAVFLGNAVEAPRVVRLVLWETADFFHPVATPGTGIEKRHHAERLAGSDPQSPKKILAANHLRCSRIVGVEQEVDAIEQSLLQPIGCAPIDEECA